MPSIRVAQHGTHNDVAKAFVNQFHATRTQTLHRNAQTKHPTVQRWNDLVLDTSALNSTRELQASGFLGVSEDGKFNAGHVLHVQCNPAQAQLQQERIAADVKLRGHCTVLDPPCMVQQLFLEGSKQQLSDGVRAQTLAYNLDFFGTEQSQFLPAEYFLLHREDLLPPAAWQQPVWICSTFVWTGGFANFYPPANRAANQAETPAMLHFRLQQLLTQLHISANAILVPLPAVFLWSGPEIQQAKRAGVQLHISDDKRLMLMLYRSGICTMATVAHLSQKMRDGLPPHSMTQPGCPALLRDPAADASRSEEELLQTTQEEEAKVQQHVISSVEHCSLPTTALEQAIAQSYLDFPEMTCVLQDPTQCQISYVVCDFLASSALSDKEKRECEGRMVMMDCVSRLAAGEVVRGTTGAQQQLAIVNGMYDEHGHHRAAEDIPLEALRAAAACPIDFESKRPPQINFDRDYLNRRPNNPARPAYTQFNMAWQSPRSGKTKSGKDLAAVQPLSTTLDFRANLISPQLRPHMPVMKIWYNGHTPLLKSGPNEIVPSGFRLFTSSRSTQPWFKYLSLDDSWHLQKCQERNLNYNDATVLRQHAEEQAHIAQFGTLPGHTALLPVAERAAVWAQQDLLQSWRYLLNIIPPQLFLQFSNGYDPFSLLQYQGKTLMWILHMCMQCLDEDKKLETKVNRKSRHKRHQQAFVTPAQQTPTMVKLTHPIVVSTVAPLVGMDEAVMTRQIAIACADECDNIFATTSSTPLAANHNSEDVVERPYVDTATALIRRCPTVGFSGTKAPCRGTCNPTKHKLPANKCQCVGSVLRSGGYTFAQAVQDGICLGVVFCCFNHDFSSKLKVAIKAGGQRAGFELLSTDKKGNGLIIHIMLHLCKVRNVEIYGAYGHDVPRASVMMLFRVPNNCFAEKMVNFVNRNAGPGGWFEGERAIALLSTKSKQSNDERYKQALWEGATMIFVNKATRAYDFPTVRLACDLLMKKDDDLSDRDTFQFIMRGASICPSNQMTGNWPVAEADNKARFLKFINSMETRVFMLSLEEDFTQAQRLMAELGGGRLVVSGANKDDVRYVVDGTGADRNIMALDPQTEQAWWKAEKEAAAAMPSAMPPAPVSPLVVVPTSLAVSDTASITVAKPLLSASAVITAPAAASAFMPIRQQQQQQPQLPTETNRKRGRLVPSSSLAKKADSEESAREEESEEELSDSDSSSLYATEEEEDDDDEKMPEHVLIRSRPIAHGATVPVPTAALPPQLSPATLLSPPQSPPTSPPLLSPPPPSPLPSSPSPSLPPPPPSPPSLPPPLSALAMALQHALITKPSVCHNCTAMCYPKLRRFTNSLPIAFWSSMPTFNSKKHSHAEFVKLGKTKCYGFKRPTLCDVCFKNQALELDDSTLRPLLGMKEQVTILRASKDKRHVVASLDTVKVEEAFPHTITSYNAQEAAHAQLKAFQAHGWAYENAWSGARTKENKQERDRTRWLVPTMAHLWCDRESRVMTVSRLCDLLAEPLSLVISQALPALSAFVMLSSSLPNEADPSQFRITLRPDSVLAAEYAADTYGTLQLLDLHKDRVYSDYQNLTMEHAELVRAKLFKQLAADLDSWKAVTTMQDKRWPISLSPADVATFGTGWHFGAESPAWHVWQCVARKAAIDYEMVWTIRMPCLRILMRHLAEAEEEEEDDQDMLEQKSAVVVSNAFERLQQEPKAPPEEEDSPTCLRLRIRDSPQAFPVADFPLPPSHNASFSEKNAYREQVAKVLYVTKVQVAYEDIRLKELESGKILAMIGKNMDTEAVVAVYKGRLLYMKVYPENAVRLRKAARDEGKARKLEGICHKWEKGHWFLAQPTISPAAVSAHSIQSSLLNM